MKEANAAMPNQLLLAATLLASTTQGRHFHIGPWIIVPILILAAIIAIPIYVVRDRRKRRATESENEWPRSGRQ
jgi:Flp pilus assembly protein TadB